MDTATTRRTTARQGLSVGAFVVSTTYVFLALGLIVWVLLPTLFLGLRPVVISSGSMAPLIRTGDVVLVSPDPTADDIVPGSVLTYHDARHDRLVTHRVTEETDAGWITRGDANAHPDAGVVTLEAVQGRARLLVPFVGAPLAWLRDGRFLLTLAWLGLTTIAVRAASAAPAEGVRHRGATDDDAAAVSPSAAPSLGLTQLLLLGTVAALLVAIPSSSAAFTTASGSTGNGFSIGTWGIPQTLYAATDGTWSATAPTTPDASRLWLAPGDSVDLPVTTTTEPTTLSGDTTVELWVRRRAKPAPLALDVTLTWATGTSSGSATARITGTPTNDLQPWTVTLPTAGWELPTGTELTLELALADALDEKDPGWLEIGFGGTTGPTSITFSDPIS